VLQRRRQLGSYNCQEGIELTLALGDGAAGA